MPGKGKLDHMIEVDDGGSVNAKEMLRIEPAAEILNRHSVDVGGGLQMQANEVSVALNPHDVVERDQDDPVFGPDGHPSQEFRET